MGEFGGGLKRARKGLAASRRGLGPAQGRALRDGGGDPRERVGDDAARRRRKAQRDAQGAAATGVPGRGDRSAFSRRNGRRRLGA